MLLDTAAGFFDLIAPCAIVANLIDLLELIKVNVYLEETECCGSSRRFKVLISVSHSMRPHDKGNVCGSFYRDMDEMILNNLASRRGSRIITTTRLLTPTYICYCFTTSTGEDTITIALSVPNYPCRLATTVCWGDAIQHIDFRNTQGSTKGRHVDGTADGPGRL